MMPLVLKLQTINYKINRGGGDCCHGHGAAIQLDPAPTNVLISYIIGVGGYFFLPLSNARLILIEINLTPLARRYLGKVISMKYIEK